MFSAFLLLFYGDTYIPPILPKKKTTQSTFRVQKVHNVLQCILALIGELVGSK